LRILTMVKKVSATYSQANGQTLPGFMNEPDIVGLTRSDWSPGVAFVLGTGGDIFNSAVTNGWLSTDSILSNPYIKRGTETYNYRVNAEPLSGFKIDIVANRTYAETFQEYFRANQYGEFEIFTPTNGGSFSMSTLLWNTSFVNDYDDGSEGSPLFDNLLAYRKIIAGRIANSNQQWMESVNSYTFDTIANDYFPKGYSASSMEVVMYSFIAAYSGQNPETISLNPFPKVPLPNWSVSYTGLSNIPALSKVFKTISINHAYRSTYAISSWASNVYYDENNTIQTFENSDIIVPAYDIAQMVLTEQYSPLLGVNLGFQNTLSCDLQYKKSRTLTLSFSNNQLTEINGREIVIGTGYRFKDLKFKVIALSGDGKGKTIKNDLVLKVDLGFRRDKTTLRRIDEKNCQVSAGQNKINLYVTADYTFSQRLSGQAFFKRDVTSPFTSTSIPTATTFAGVTLRFSLAQ